MTHEATAKPGRRHLLGCWATTAVLVALGSFAGCSSSDAEQAPEDAAESTFCSSYTNLGTRLLEEVDPAAEPDQQRSQALTALEDWAESLSAVGTPKGTPEQARAGFVAYLDAAVNLPEGTDLSDLGVITAGLDDGAADDYAALTAYIQETCSD